MRLSTRAQVKAVLAPDWVMYTPSMASGLRQLGPGGMPREEFSVICWFSGSQSPTVAFTMLVLAQGSVPWESPSVPSFTPPKSVSGRSHIVHVMFSM